MAVLQGVDVDHGDPAAAVGAAHALGVPARHQQPAPVDVLGVAGVGRGGDALGPPAARWPRRRRSSGTRRSTASRAPARAPPAGRGAPTTPASADAAAVALQRRASMSAAFSLGTAAGGCSRGPRSPVQRRGLPLGWPACVRWWGSAIIERGRVLAARRAHPPPWPGSGSCPGGKVEPGESLDAAAVREIREELGCAVEVTGRWRGRSADRRRPASCAWCWPRLTAGDPVPREHDAVRWLRAERVRRGRLGRGRRTVPRAAAGLPG